MTGTADGQVFALIVMIVAAGEVVVGLGLIVAMYRNRLPMDVDEMSELQRMSADHLRLAGARVPARGLDRDRARLARSWRGRTAGWIGSAAIGLAFLNAIGALIAAPGQPAEERARSRPRCGTTPSPRAST